MNVEHQPEAGQNSPYHSPNVNEIQSSIPHGLVEFYAATAHSIAARAGIVIPQELAAVYADIRNQWYINEAGRDIDPNNQKSDQQVLLDVLLEEYRNGTILYNDLVQLTAFYPSLRAVSPDIKPVAPDLADEQYSMLLEERVAA